MHAFLLMLIPIREMFTCTHGFNQQSYLIFKTNHLTKFSCSCTIVCDCDSSYLPVYCTHPEIFFKWLFNLSHQSYIISYQMRWDQKRRTMWQWNMSSQSGYYSILGMSASASLFLFFCSTSLISLDTLRASE